jgi:[protein-PII] uridylyltransferase
VLDHAAMLDRRRAGEVATASRIVEEGFVLADGRLEISHAQLLEERPVRMLSAFGLAQRYDVGLSARAQRLIKQHLELIDDAFRENPEAAGIFRQILRAKNRVYRTLAAMNELGVLGAYLPEFGEIVGLWQQDLYHTYTVDAHSLFLVEQLRRLEKGRYVGELDLASELIREAPMLDVLYLGCLLHDIGKGKGGRHSSRGAEIVPEIGRRLGLTSEEVAPRGEPSKAPNPLPDDGGGHSQRLPRGLDHVEGGPPREALPEYR